MGGSSLFIPLVEVNFHRAVLTLEQDLDEGLVLMLSVSSIQLPIINMNIVKWDQHPRNDKIIGVGHSWDGRSYSPLDHHMSKTYQ